MKKSDLSCPTCRAGYRRIELTSRSGAKGEFQCVLCGEVLERFDGSTEVAIRLTVQPEKTFELQGKPGSLQSAK
jgi:transposase-like protein